MSPKNTIIKEDVPVKEKAVKAPKAPKLKKEPKLKKTSTKPKKPADIAIHLDNFELLAKKYRPLIISIIRKVQKIYSNYSASEYEDLYQEGLIALYQSINNFDPTKGVFFGLYLKVALSNSLRYYFRNFLPDL